MKRKTYGRDNTKDMEPPKPKAKFPEGKKEYAGKKGKGKEIVPPHAKDKPYGGKKDPETKEQNRSKKITTRTPADDSDFAFGLRKAKKEYRN